MVKLSHPFSMLISGGRGVGKTVFTKKILKNATSIIDNPPERIAWCYAKHQPALLDELLKIVPDIEYAEGIPENLESMFNRSVSNLVILDDLMDEGGDSKAVSQLFTRGRHDNLSVIFLTQNLFHPKQRNISLNSDYMVIFKNIRDKSQFTNLAKQFMPNHVNFMRWVFQDATRLPHSYLFLDMKPETEEELRIKTNILPDEAPQYVYMK